MASKGNVGQIVAAAVSAIVTVLLTTPLDSGSTLAGMAVKVLPRLALGVVAGLATMLLTFVGRKVRPSFRTRSTRFKDLAQEIEELYDYKMDQLVDPKQMGDLSVNRFLQRCNELKAKLNRLGISSPEPLRGSSRWRDFLRILHGCVIQGNVKGARGVLERLEDADQKPAATATRPTSRHGGADE